MAKHDIDTLQKEVFDYLLKKHETEKKHGREFYFSSLTSHPKFLKNILLLKVFYPKTIRVYCQAKKGKLLPSLINVIPGSSIFSGFLCPLDP